MVSEMVFVIEVRTRLARDACIRTLSMTPILDGVMLSRGDASPIVVIVHQSTEGSASAVSSDSARPRPTAGT